MAMINNYNELKNVKRELRTRVRQTEQNYLEQYEWISAFFDASGIYKDKKNGEKKKNLHTLIIQSITEYLKDQQVFSKYKEEYTKVLIPFALSLISALLVKKL
jgi:hypothetical protein